MSHSVDVSRFVRRSADGRAEIDFAVEGIGCAGCIGRIERAVSHLPGAPSARLNYTTRRLNVAWQGDGFAPGEVAAALGALGYHAEPFDLGAIEDADEAQMRFLWRCLAVAGFAAMNVMLLSVSIWAGNASDIDSQTRDLFHWLSALIALPAAAYAGQPFFRSAALALRSRSMNMDVPISVGIVMALGMSLVETARHAEHAYFDSALMLIFFLLAGRALEHAMRKKTRSIANNLASLRAPSACRIGKDGGTAEVPVAALSPGEIVLVRPGDRVPADGIVTSGRSALDEGIITGETRERPIGPGDTAYAGSLNLSGTIHIEVRAAGADTVLDEIERLLESAAAEKSRYVRLADRVARLYAPVVHLAALLTAIGWLIAGASLHDALVTAIAVLIITCPCALALAVPAVHVVASGAVFRAGVLLHKGEAIERLADIDTIVFDKTGTMTLPEARVTNRQDVDAELFATAARLALSSHHPLARSLAVEAGRFAPFDEAVEEPGLGVHAMVGGSEARLGSLEFCGIKGDAPAADDAGSLIAFRVGERTAVFRIEQSLRKDAAVTLRRLSDQGFAIEILSGDRDAIVQRMARTLGVATARGDLKPAAKVARLTELANHGRKVLMVGDGLNDAPALALAHVSLSPASAADLAQSASDAVFLGELLAPVAASLAVARKAKRLMRQNLALALIYNGCAVPFAMAGLATPLIAALAMSGSSLLVTLNALRARGPQAPAEARPGVSSRPAAEQGTAARMGLAS